MIEPLYIEGTDETPAVVLDPKKQKFSFDGNSYPENTSNFYMPILEWLSNFKSAFDKDPSIRNQLKQPLVFEFNLDYFNTSSAKYILEILRVLEALHNNGTQVLVKWYYLEDDEDMYEAGNDYQMSVNVPFELVVKEEEEEDFFSF